MKKSAIVIPCFNRLEPLNNLVKTICKANISEKIDLVFSIDYSGTDTISQYAESLNWPYGNKIIYRHPQNIGLRSNIIFCGDLLLTEYDRIILLEDDLLVSKGFVDFALKAADFYENEPEIAGISLFSYYACEEGLFNFYPLKDEFDTFFIQWPSSWGQLWTKKQWKQFREWLSLEYDFSKVNLPESVKGWRNSWKKYFAAYLTENNLYFVYPYFSFTAESCSAGVHFNNSYNYSLFNNNLCQESENAFKFRPYSATTLYRYDCFFQLMPRRFINNQESYQVSYDLYGTKNPENILTPYVITAKDAEKSILSFGHTLIPFELNVLETTKGQTFLLMDKETYHTATLSLQKKLVLRMSLNAREMAKYVIMRCSTKIFRLIGINH